MKGNGKMSEMKPIMGAQNLNNVQPECIRTLKVYDWVVDTNRYTNKIPVGAACLPLVNAAIAAGQRLDIDCDIIDTDCVVDPNVEYNVPVNLPGGGTTTLTLVNITWIATFEITITNTVTGDTCTFTDTVYFNDDYYLCLPEPLTADNVICRITAADCRVNPSRILGNMINVTVTICKDVQVEHEVKLEVEAKFCQPRDIIPVDQNGVFPCPPFDFPEQCPVVFPRENCCGTAVFNVQETITATTTPSSPGNEGLFRLIGEICRNCANNRLNTNVFAEWDDSTDNSLDFEFRSTNVTPPTNFNAGVTDFPTASGGYGTGSFCFEIARDPGDDYGIRLQGEGTRTFADNTTQAVLFDLTVWESDPGIGSKQYRLRLFTNSYGPGNLVFDTGIQVILPNEAQTLIVEECTRF